MEQSERLSREADGSVNRLRNAIDHGRTRDKVNWPDPAAAPLGTDEEAAGTPVRSEAVTTAAAREIKANDDAEPRRHVMGAAWILVAVVALTAVALVASLLLLATSLLL